MATKRANTEANALTPVLGLPPALNVSGDSVAIPTLATGINSNSVDNESFDEFARGSDEEFTPEDLPQQEFNTAVQDSFNNFSQANMPNPD